MDCWSKYRDVRKVFFESINRNWDHSSYDFIIACDEDISAEKNDALIVVCDKSLTDSRRHLEALKLVRTEYVLLVVEDGMIEKKVNNDRIEEILDFMDNNQIDFCKLVKMPNGRGKKIKDLNNAKYINKRQAYGINYLCGIYRKTFLFSLLGGDCKDSWEIEESLLKESANSEKGFFDNKILVTDNPLNIVFCVEKGKWSHWARKRILKNGYSFNSGRETWSFWHDCLAKIKHLSSSCISSKKRVLIKSILSKIGIRFATKE